jgi:hypothetical protein
MGMRGIEFLPPEEDQPSRRAGRPGDVGTHRERRSPLLVGVVALAVVAVAAVVVGRGGGGRPGSSATRSAPAARSTSPSPSGPPTLSLQYSAAFGPQVVDLLAVGNRVFALTPTLVGVAVRDGGPLTVRPAPLGLSNQTGVGRIVPDLTHHLLWVIALGGTTIGGYGSDHLDSVADLQVAEPITGAAALDGRLWFTTSHALFQVAPGHRPPRRVLRSATALGPIAADPGRHRVLVAAAGSPARLTAYSASGPLVGSTQPFEHATSLAVTGGLVWETGYGGGTPVLVHIDARSLQADRMSPLTGQLAVSALIVARYAERLLVKGDPASHALYCLDARDGSLKQRWTVPSGAVTLSERGLLVASDRGIEQFNARDCLAG